MRVGRRSIADGIDRCHRIGEFPIGLGNANDIFQRFGVIPNGSPPPWSVPAPREALTKEYDEEAKDPLHKLGLDLHVCLLDEKRLFL